MYTIVSQPFNENSYVVSRPGRSDCLVIDPGLEPDPIIEYLDGRKLVPAAILNTHGHAGLAVPWSSAAATLPS